MKMWFFLPFLLMAAVLPVFSEVSKGQPDPFIVITIPKCGTHLMINCIKQLTGLRGYGNHIEQREKIEEWVDQLVANWNDGKCYIQHQKPYPKVIELLQEQNFKVIFMIRDPRDQLISLINWLEEGRWPGTVHPQLRSDEMTRMEKIQEAITGEVFGDSLVDQYYRSNLPWMDQPSDFVLVVRFEDLVGPKGGGTLKRQTATVERIAHHIGLKLKPAEVLKISDQIFGNSNTFRKGQIGSWKEEFNDSLKTLFKSYFGQELIDLEYESDFDW